MAVQKIIMKAFTPRANILVAISLMCPFLNFAQSTSVVAGQEYKRSKLHDLLWGKHYRKEWLTPIRVPLLSVDTAAGGLTLYELVTGKASNTMHLRNGNNKEYILRSIDKKYGNELATLYQGTFIERI